MPPNRILGVCELLVLFLIVSRVRNWKYYRSQDEPNSDWNQHPVGSCPNNKPIDYNVYNDPDHNDRCERYDPLLDPATYRHRDLLGTI